MRFFVLPLERLAVLGEPEDSVGRREWRHLRVTVEEPLRGVAVLVVQSQHVQPIKANLRDRFDQLHLPRRNLENECIRLNVLDGSRRDPQSAYDVE